MVKRKYAMTPADIHPQSLPIPCEFAFLCSCPMPTIFETYDLKQPIPEGMILHNSSHDIKFCEFRSKKFLVIANVYGSVMVSAAMEELCHYKINKVIGIGFVGSVDKDLQIGDNIFVDEVSYDRDAVSDIYEKDIGNTYITQTSHSAPLSMKSVEAFTTSAIFRESEDFIHAIKLDGCQVINMETAALYVVATYLNMDCFYCATVSDIIDFEDEKKVETNHLGDAIINPKNIVRQKQDSLIFDLLHLQTCPSRSNVVSKTLEFLSSNELCKSHDFKHAQAVMSNALQAITDEKQLTIYQKEAILIASLLHDIDDPKFFKSTNLQNMRTILHDFPSDFIELVAEMINLVSCSKNGDSMVAEEWKLYPRYADRCEALGRKGIERCYQYAKTVGNPLLTNETPLPNSEEELWNIATIERYKNYNGKSASFLDHFYDKLLRLGNFPISNNYLNEKAKESTKETVSFVLDFCKANDKEAFMTEFFC